MKFCSVCDNYLYLNTTANSLIRECRTCGEKVTEEKGGLILETHVQQRANEGYKILLNEFTKFDPTLPHLKTMKCPNGGCNSNKPSGAADKDVIYIKYDKENMKYLYICTVCDKEWRSRPS